MSTLNALLMRLRLFHKLALVTTLLMAFTIVALAGVMIRNLRKGFNSYLDERDQEQLTVFAGVVGEAMEKSGTSDGQEALNMHSLLDEQAKREEVSPRRVNPRAGPPMAGSERGTAPMPAPGEGAEAGSSTTGKGPVGLRLPPGAPNGPPNEAGGGPPDFAGGMPPGFPGDGGPPPDGPPPGMEAGGPPGPPPDNEGLGRAGPQGKTQIAAASGAGLARRGSPRRPAEASAPGAAATGVSATRTAGPSPPAQPAQAFEGPPNLNMDTPGRGFSVRVSVLSPDGKVLAGPTFAKGQPVIEEPVISHGKLLAKVQLIKVTRASESLDERFLRDQIVAIVIVSGVAFVLALGGILLVSRRLAQPLLAAQSATARIASGDFTVRLPEGGTDEVADLVRNINAMAGSLETLERSRKKWLAELSHELRTPLTVLQGECEAMIDGIRPITVDAIGALHDRALALNRIVADLHTVSLADLGALPHVFEEMDAVELVEHVLSAARHRLGEHGLTATFADSPQSLPVRWDEGRITQLLDNLLENSLRYTDAPGKIRVKLSADADRVTLQWEDSAPCVTAEELDQLFEPLYRANPERSRQQGGSGLGLAICRAIVRAHRGTVRAEASAWGGVCILVVLPADASPLESARS